MMPDYGEADFPLRNLPHLWGRGTAIAVEGALPKVTLTVRHQYPQPLRGHWVPKDAIPITCN